MLKHAMPVLRDERQMHFRITVIFELEAITRMLTTVVAVSMDGSVNSFITLILKRSPYSQPFMNDGYSDLICAMYAPYGLR